MRYPAIVIHEGKYTIADFPDCPGCVTQADPGESIEAMAKEALEGWLETHLGRSRELAPRPPKRAPKVPRDAELLWVDVSPNLAAKLSLRWVRHELGLTQAQLAKRAGVTQQAIAKLEDPDSNPTIETLEKVAAALGARLTVELEPLNPQA